MAKGIRRFDRRIRPAEDTGEIPVQDAEHDDEHAGLETDLQSPTSRVERIGGRGSATAALRWPNIWAGAWFRSALWCWHG